MTLYPLSFLSRNFLKTKKQNSKARIWARAADCGLCPAPSDSAERRIGARFIFDSKWNPNIKKKTN